MGFPTAIFGMESTEAARVCLLLQSADVNRTLSFVVSPREDGNATGMH